MIAGCLGWGGGGFVGGVVCCWGILERNLFKSEALSKHGLECV